MALYSARLAAIDAVFGQLTLQVRQARLGDSQALNAMGEMLDLVAAIGATDPGMAPMVRDLVSGGRAAVSNMFKTRRACLLLLAGAANAAIALRVEDALRVSEQNGRHVVELLAPHAPPATAPASAERSPKSVSAPPVFTILARPPGAADYPAYNDKMQKSRVRGSRGGVRHNGGRPRQNRDDRRGALPPIGLDVMDRILADAVSEFSAPLGGPSYLTALLSPPPARPKSEPKSEPEPEPEPKPKLESAPLAATDVMTAPKLLAWGDEDDEDIFAKGLPQDSATAKPKRAPRAKKT
jgi:hypothetical protein